MHKLKQYAYIDISEVLKNAEIVIVGATGTEDNIENLMEQVIKLKEIEGKRMSSFLICHNVYEEEDWQEDLQEEIFEKNKNVVLLPGLLIDGKTKDIEGELARIDGWITTMFTYNKGRD